MILVLARHVECRANTERRHVGRSESAVTPRGERQAELMAAALAGDGGLDVVRIVSSPLGRALRTAQAIAGALTERDGATTEVAIDERFAELDYGELDGAPVDELSSDDTWRFDPAVPVPGGESLAEASARVGAACAELLGAGSPGAGVAGAGLLGAGPPGSASPGSGLAGAGLLGAGPGLAGVGPAGDVVVVSHVLPIKLAVCWAIGAGPLAVWRMDLAIASLGRVTSRNGSIRLVSYNEHRYLGKDASPPVWR